MQQIITIYRASSGCYALFLSWDDTRGICCLASFRVSAILSLLASLVCREDAGRGYSIDLNINTCDNFNSCDLTDGYNFN